MGGLWSRMPVCVNYWDLECNVPLMRSKKGELICCGCDRDYSIKREPDQRTDK